MFILFQFHTIYHLIYTYFYTYICIDINTQLYLYVCISIYIYIYMCVCVCVCVCVLIYLQCIHLHAYIYTYECLYISIITYKFKLYIHIYLFDIQNEICTYRLIFTHMYTYLYMSTSCIEINRAAALFPRAGKLSRPSGNFYSRINTFFRTSIDFLIENFQKIEIFKIFNFVKFFASGAQSSS